MHKGRRSSANGSPLHAVCELHREGLYDVPELVNWILQNKDNRLRIAREVAKHTDLFEIITGLRAGNFNADFAARQITDDCFRLGMLDAHQYQNVIEHMVKAVYALQDRSDR